MVRRFIAPRVWALATVVAAAVAALAAQAPSSGISSAPTPFPRLAILPTPGLPDWIVQISPIGPVVADSQVRIRFKEPLIALEAIESPDQQRKLALFEIEPSVPGSFRFITPHMVGFEPDRQLPLATNFHVTVKRGLTDLAGHSLTHDIVWSFSTDQIDLSLPSGDHYVLDPPLEISSNVELVVPTLQRRLTIRAAGHAIAPLTVALASPGYAWKPEPEASSGEQYYSDWHYRISIPRLSPATHYDVSVNAGVEPAWGNMPMATPTTTGFDTYEPLAFLRLGQHRDYNERGGPLFDTGVRTVDFNNDLRPESERPGIRVQDDAGQAVTGGSTTIEQNALRPATHYVVNIAAGITDVFGQRLGKPVEADFLNGDYSPDFWAPDGFLIIPAGSKLELRFASINVPSQSYAMAHRVVRPEDLVYFSSAEPLTDDPRQRFAPGLLPLPETWKAMSVDGPRNVQLDIPLRVRQLLGVPYGLLGYGAFAQTYGYNDAYGPRVARPTYYGLVQITDLGVFAQVMPEVALVRAHRLSNGEPVGGAHVSLYVRHDGARERPSPVPCATGTTDASGTASFDAAALAPCRTGSDVPKLLIVVRSGEDWAFVRTDAPDWNAWINAGWGSGQIEPRGALFPDRDLYQPGETATLTAAAFYLKDDELLRDAGGRYDVTLIDQSNVVKHVGTHVANDFGTFTIAIPLDPAQKPGYYRVSADGASGNHMEGQFQVAEFKPPAFKLAIAVDRHVAVAGELVVASANGSYLFGSPLTGATAKWFVTRAEQWRRYWYAKPSWVPEKYRSYAFGKLWIDPEKRPEVQGDVLKAVTKFSAAGRASLGVAVEKTIPYPLTYFVELEASDASARSVAVQQGFDVLPAPELIGLSASWPVVAGMPAPINVVVVNRHANDIPGRRVHLVLQRRLVDEHDHATYTPVAVASAITRSEPVAAALTPPAPGDYRVVANFEDASGDAAETDMYVPAIVKPSPTPQPTPTQRPLAIEFANDSPHPGDREDVQIALPYDDAEVYMAVARHRVFDQVTMRATGGKAHFAFTVTAAMAPNAYFEVQAVRRGPPHNGATAIPGETLSQLATRELFVNTEDRKLQVTVTPLERSLEPHTRQTLAFHVRDQSGHAARAEIAVAVVDDAVLQLTNYRPPDLYDGVWAAIPASVLVADNRQNVLLEPLQSQLLYRFGYRPGQTQVPEEVAVAAGATANVYAARALRTLGAITSREALQSSFGQRPFVRKNFSVLAYYNGAVVTNAAGDARVSFQVPDSLTSWRVMAVAIGAAEGGGNRDLRFGRAEASFVTRKPVAANPLLPQFARPNDRFKPGVNITNDTGLPGTGRVIATVSGPLALEQNGRLTRTLEFDQLFRRGTYGRRIDALATGWGTGRVQFEALLGKYGDAFEATVPLLPFEVTEYAVETGTTTTRAAIPLDIDPGVDPNVGGLTVTLASTLLPEITVPSARALGDTDLPLLEPAASRLAVAVNLIILDKHFKRPVLGFDPAPIAALQLEHLVELQNQNGGFSYWPGYDISDPWCSAYAAEVLGRAIAAGVDVNPQMIEALKQYLRAVIDSPSAYATRWCDDLCQQGLRLDAMLGLLALGEQRPAHLREVYAVRNAMDFADRVRLARLLTLTPGWQAEARSLTVKLQEVIYETGRSATVNIPGYWWWFNSDICAQSQMLRLFVVQRVEPAIVDRMLRGLLGRLNGRWINGYDNAQALTAIVDYAALEPEPPNFTATAGLAGRQVGAATFKGYEHTSTEVSVPMNRLPRLRSELVLAKSGTGRLHYVVQYGYRLKGPQAGRVNGFRVERRVSAAGQISTLIDVGLTPPVATLSLAVDEIYDVAIHVVVDHPVDHVVISDPLPAGLEAIDQAFHTATRYYQTPNNWGFCYQTIYRDRIVLYADQLETGAYDVHYLVRSVTPGIYQWPGASVSLLYAPEEFGRTASSIIAVTEKP